MASHATLDDLLVLYAHGELPPADAALFELQLHLRPELHEGLERYQADLALFAEPGLLSPSRGTMQALWARMAHAELEHHIAPEH